MNKKLFITALSLLVLLLTWSFTYNEQGESALSLRDTFDLYVESVQNSDIDGLFKTVTDSEDFFFVTGRGELIGTREGYRKFHEDWFAETDWEMPVKLLEVNEGRDYGYTNAIFYYKSTMSGGKTVCLDSYFTLIFSREGGEWKVVADICAPIERYESYSDADVRYSEAQQYLFDIIHSRRTVRSYKSTPVPEEHLMRILDAARMCPTAGNQQPWKFLVIRDRKKLDMLKTEALNWYVDSYRSRTDPPEQDIDSAKERVRESLDGALSAPVYVAVLVDSKARYPDYVVYDGTLAAGYLMIAARALNYGTGFFTTYFPNDKMQQFFDIPDRYQLICFTPIGIPEEWPAVPNKKELSEFVVFEEF